MPLFTGLAGAVLCGVPLWLVLRAATANLPVLDRLAVTLSVLGLAVLVGFLVGAALGRRAAFNPSRLIAFGLVAGGMGGGIIAAGLSAAVTTAYLLTFGAWPQDLLYQILYVLAIPAFAVTGWFAGAIAGGILGLAGGTLLRGLSPLRR